LRVAAIENQLTQSKDVMLYFNYAKESLNSGNTKQAIETIQLIINNNPRAQTVNAQSKMFHEFLAICYLRLGEQENCQDNHNDASCIIPLAEKGLHTLPMGSEKAISKYKEILAVFPEDNQSRWLLNLAYITLGKYPHEVPKSYLIPMHSLDSEMAFRNTGTQLGVDDFDLSGSVIADDFNGDGLVDIICSSWGLNGKLKYYENGGKSGFQDKTKSAGLDKVKGGLNLKQADIDNDGDLDFIILRGAWRPRFDWGILPNSLMRNDGKASFSDITLESGVYSKMPTQSAEWFDYNNDGLIDLYIANETNPSSSERFPCALYKNLGSNNFENVAHETGAALIGYFKGVSSGDFNNDGYRDIFLSNLKGANVLLQNNGGSSFSNITKQAGVDKPYAAFPCWFFDADNDGYEDIFVSSYDEIQFTDQSGQLASSYLKKPLRTESLKFYKNRDGVSFEDKTDQFMDYTAIGTMGCNYGDIDNDGFLDFYLGTGATDYRSVVPNRFFSNQGGKKFVDKTFALGLGHIQKGHGIAFADFDNDGDQDIYAVMGGAFEGDIFPNALFENPGSNNNFLKLKLVGTVANKSAIGAKIHLVTKQNGVERSVYHTVGSGASFGANTLIAHLGLDQSDEIIKLTIRWPNADMAVRSYTDLKVNSFYTIYEDKSAPELTMQASFVFDKKHSSGHSHHHH